MHICGQTNIHHPLIHCLRIILQCFCFYHLSARGTERWFCCGGFGVIFKVRFLFTTEVRAGMRRCGHAPERKLNRHGRIMFEYSGWHSAQGKLGLFYLKSWAGFFFFFSSWMQGLQEVMEMFLLTSVGVGVGLLLFSFFTRFLFQLLCSPAHLNQQR